VDTKCWIYFKKNKNFNTIINNNCVNVLSNRVSHFNISSTKYNKKRVNCNAGKTIEAEKRKKSNNAVKIKTSQVSTENNLKNIKSTKTEENLNSLINNINNENNKDNNNSNIKNENIQNIKTIKNNNYIRKIIDENEIKNKDPQFVEEYLEEILCNLFLEEKIFLEKIGFQMSSDYLSNYGINPETRTCLIDSLIDLQKIFNFNDVFCFFF